MTTHILPLILASAAIGISLLLANLCSHLKQITARNRVLTDTLGRQRVIEILSWSVDCARMSLPSPPPRLEAFDAYGREYALFAAEIDHLRGLANDFSMKWGTVWGFGNTGTLKECADEAWDILDNIRETSSFRGHIIELYHEAQLSISPQVPLASINATANNCLVKASEIISLIAERS